MQGLRGATCEPVSFWVRCHNPECLYEHIFAQDISYASQVNWVCPRCDTPLFDSIDLSSLNDNTVIDIAENLFSPSPARTEAPPPSDNDLMALAAPLFTPSPVKKKTASSDKENVSLETERRLREATTSDKKASPSKSVISVSSSDSPYGGSVFLPLGPYLTIDGLVDARRVGEAVFYITFPRKNSFTGRLAVGLVRDSVLGHVRVSRLKAQGQEPSLHGDFTLCKDASKAVLNLDYLSLVSPSFSIVQMGCSVTEVQYRLSSEMLEWFQEHGGQYRPMGGRSEGFEGVLRRWQKALVGEKSKSVMGRVINVIGFLHCHPFQCARVY